LPEKYGETFFGLGLETDTMELLMEREAKEKRTHEDEPTPEVC
jgi:hypothetical protein